MWYLPAKQTSPPASEPVSVAEVKSHTYIDHADDDGEIGMLISAACDHIERYCNIRLMTQTIDVKCDSFDDFAFLPFGPVQSISAVKYIDTAGAEQTVDASVYELRADGSEACIVTQYGKTWPARRIGTRITVTAIVGYEKLPAAIKHALLLYVAVGFSDREAREVVTFSTADALLANFRHGA